MSLRWKHIYCGFESSLGRFTLGVVMSLTLVGISKADTKKDRQKVLITGSSTLAPLMTTLATEYEKKHPNVQIDVQTGGSSKGIADCRKGLNDVGMISRSLKASESAVESISVASDGLAFIAHGGLTVNDLTPEQIADIYRAKVSNWKELGGPDLAITPVSKAEGRAALELFKKYFKLKSSEIKAGVIVGDEAHGVKTVASTKGSIGFVSVTTAMQATSVQKQSVVKSVKVAGASPTAADLRSGAYPYSRKLQLVKCRDLRKAVKEFVDFALSAEGQKVVERVGYIPL